MTPRCHWDECPHGANCVHAQFLHVSPDAADGGCTVCAECDGDEGHEGLHDCGHEEAAS